jgi:hypothetical protein
MLMLFFRILPVSPGHDRMPPRPAAGRRFPDPGFDVEVYCNKLLADAGRSRDMQREALLERIYLVVITQIERNLVATWDHEGAAAFQALLEGPGFHGPLVWDFLAGTASGPAIRERIGQTLECEWARNAFISALNADPSTRRKLLKAHRARTAASGPAPAERK